MIQMDIIPSPYISQLISLKMGGV